MNLKIPLTYIHIKDVFSKLDKNIICSSTSASNDQPNSTYKKNSFSRVTTLVTMETDVNSLTRSSPLTCFLGLTFVSYRLAQNTSILLIFTKAGNG